MEKVTSLSKASLSCSVFCYTEQQSWQQIESNHCSGQHNKSNCQSGTGDTSVLPHKEWAWQGLALPFLDGYFSCGGGGSKTIIVYKIKRSHLFLFFQSQQKQMQEILKGLSTKENEGQSLNNDIEKKDSLVDQLRKLVTEREAKIKMLEGKLEQLTLRVGRTN